jgi:hypothetical protein
VQGQPDPLDETRASPHVHLADYHFLMRPADLSRLNYV